MPKKAPATDPTTMPMTGAHRRRLPVERSAITSTTAKVTAAQTGPLAAEAPSGEAATMSKMSGMTVTAISMSTVPATVGVRSRRNSDSFDDSRNWNSDDATTSVAMSAGPPSTSAATHTAMNAPEVPISRT